MTSDYPARLDVLATDLARLSTDVVTASTRSIELAASSELRTTVYQAFEADDNRLLESTLYAEPFAFPPDSERELLIRLAPQTGLFALFVLHVLEPTQALELVGGPSNVVGDAAQVAVQLFGFGGSNATPAAAKPWGGSQAASLTMIIHGTGASKDSWWRPTGQFAQDVHAVTGDVYQFDDYFRWTGKNRNADRHQAAADLKDWVDAHLQPNGDLRVIAHSHGGNVAMLATRLGLSAAQLILLGTPMRTEYVPAMDEIARLDNVYAPQDVVQSPGGTVPYRRGEGRTLGDTQVITNHPLHAGVGGPLGSHEDLHEWSVWTHTDNHLDHLLT